MVCQDSQCKLCCYYSHLPIVLSELSMFLVHEKWFGTSETKWHEGSFRLNFVSLCIKIASYIFPFIFSMNINFSVKTTFAKVQGAGLFLQLPGFCCCCCCFPTEGAQILDKMMTWEFTYNSRLPFGGFYYCWCLFCFFFLIGTWIIGACHSAYPISLFCALSSHSDKGSCHY